MPNIAGVLHYARLSILYNMCWAFYIVHTKCVATKLGVYLNSSIISRLRCFQCISIHEYFWDTCEGHLFVSNPRNWKLLYHNVRLFIFWGYLFRYLNLCLLAYIFIENVRIFDIHKNQQHVPFKTNWCCWYNIKHKRRKTVKKIAK